MNPVICLDSDDEDQSNGKKGSTMPITITKTTQSNSTVSNQNLYKTIKNSMSITPVIVQANNSIQNPPPLSKIQSQTINKNQIQNNNAMRTSPVTNKIQLKNNQVQITTFKPVNPQLKTNIPATNITQKNMSNIKTSSPGITIKSSATTPKLTTTSNSPIICSSNSIEVTRIANPTLNPNYAQKNPSQLKIINSTAPISGGRGITIISKSKSLDGMNKQNITNLKTASVQGINPKLLNQYIQKKLSQNSTITITKSPTDNLQEKTNPNNNILEFKKIQQENIKKIQKNQKLTKQNSSFVITNHITNTAIQNALPVQKSIANKNITETNSIIKNKIMAEKLSKIKIKLKSNNINGIENKANLNSSGLNKNAAVEQQHKDFLIAQAQIAKISSNKNLPVNNKNSLLNVNINQPQQQQQPPPSIVQGQNKVKKMIHFTKSENPSSDTGGKRKISESITAPPSPQAYKRIKPTLVSTIVSPKYLSPTPSNSMITIDSEDEDLFIDKPPPPNQQNLTKSIPPTPIISTIKNPALITATSSTSVEDTVSVNELCQEKMEIVYDKKIKSNENAKSELIVPKITEIDGKKENAEKNLETKSNGGKKIKQVNEENMITPEYEALLTACRNAEKSDEMELLIKKKLLKYYHSVHPDYIKSRNFLKAIIATTQEIEKSPNLVYIKLKNILEELKTRKNSKLSVMINENIITTAAETNSDNNLEQNAKHDRQVKKLSKSLLKIKVIISKLDEQEVDLDNDYNSTYLQVERYKKRACLIYEKICELTGENKNAQREVGKPIIFQGTSYPDINKAIQTFVNSTKSFPDYRDILRLLEHCNNKNNLGLSSIEIGMIARDAFDKVGTLLQKRRRTELYETVTHWTGNEKDPAVEDPILSAKLNENSKKGKKISDVINKYAKQKESNVICSSDSEQSGSDKTPKINKTLPLPSDSEDEDETETNTNILGKSKENSESSNSNKDNKNNDDLTNLNGVKEKQTENIDIDSRLLKESKKANTPRTYSPQPGPSGINVASVTSPISLKSNLSSSAESPVIYVQSFNSDVNNTNNNNNIREKSKSRRNNNNENHKVLCEIILSDDDDES